jgi:hypothetical protein
MPRDKLCYVFELEVLSCDGEQWLGRGRVISTRHDDAKQIACKLAAEKLTVTERGVRVWFLGWRDSGDSNAPITGLGKFNVTILREGAAA